MFRPPVQCVTGEYVSPPMPHMLTTYIAPNTTADSNNNYSGGGGGGGGDIFSIGNSGTSTPSIMDITGSLLKVGIRGSTVSGYGSVLGSGMNSSAGSGAVSPLNCTSAAVSRQGSFKFCLEKALEKGSEKGPEKGSEIIRALEKSKVTHTSSPFDSKNKVQEEGLLIDPYHILDQAKTRRTDIQRLKRKVGRMSLHISQDLLPSRERGAGRGLGIVTKLPFLVPQVCQILSAWCVCGVCVCVLAYAHVCAM